MKKMCYNCKYRGNLIRFGNGPPDHFCENKEMVKKIKVNGETFWDCCYCIFDVCDKFKKKD